MNDQVDQTTQQAESNYEVTFSDKPVTTDIDSGQEKDGSAQPSESSADSKDSVTNAASDAGEKDPVDDDLQKQSISRVQKRIDRLTKEKYESKREALELKRELEELKAKQRTDSSDSDDDQDEPVPSKYDTWDEYQDALDKYAARKDGERKQEPSKKEDPAARHDDKQLLDEAAREHQQLLDEAASVIKDGFDEARAKHSDFDDVVFQEDLSISEDMVRVIAETEDPTEVLYQIGKNKDEAKRIASLSLPKIAIEIDKIEQSIKSGSKQKAKTDKKPTSAPEPISPVSGSSAVKRKLSDARSQAEYAEIRAEQAKQETRGAGWV